MNHIVLKALSDPTRIFLLQEIGKKRICACELPKKAKVSQPAVSQHLKVLAEADLVVMKKEGVRRLYSISARGKSVLSDISRW
ncbi:MAG: metalloregulator ArsR/SmtB family transcription factor [Candidatus Micrarchaeota archaeon]